MRALRDYASDCDSDEACFQCTFACVCEKFDNNAPKIIADLIESLTAKLASVTAERDAARERLCYTCKNGNPGAGIKHSASCDICPWRGQKGEAND